MKNPDSSPPKLPITEPKAMDSSVCPSHNIICSVGGVVQDYRGLVWGRENLTRM
ncbi:hypothetical protein Sjap_013712 [Stephania japonica]|uniref:Uncharacterized protein n=1 Tax=Stephania japonica TaxID=461633 RepID=A0AAP0IZL8_9MAGN